MHNYLPYKFSPVFKWHSNNRPFSNRTTFDHSNTRQVMYSDPHCTSNYQYSGTSRPRGSSPPPLNIGTFILLLLNLIIFIFYKFIGSTCTLLFSLFQNFFAELRRSSDRRNYYICKNLIENMDR